MLLRRQHITLFLQSLLILLACVSCTSDDVANEVPKTNTSQGNPYSIFFKIDTGELSMRTTFGGDENSDNATSGDFVHGSENEHQIGKTGNYVIFFDESKKLYAISPLTSTEHNHEGHDGYIEANYGTKIEPIEDKYPKYCLVVLNGQRVYNQLLDISKNNTSNGIQEVLNLVWEDLNSEDNLPSVGRDNEYFTMTNAIYVDGNNIKAEVEISEDNIITADKIKEDPNIINDPNKIVHIHVERMVAKFTFQLPKDNDGNDITIFQPSTEADIVMFDGFDDKKAPHYTAKKWRIELTGWNINALESQSHLFKNISTNINYFNNWNDARNFRSYWSEDPDYTNYNYPWQYRWAADYTLKNYDRDGSVLKNYSFNKLNLGKPEQGSVDWIAPIYTPEHTYNAQATGISGQLDDREELLAGTHLLIGAELQFEIDESDSKENYPDGYRTYNVYRDRSGLYYKSERECFVALIHSFNQLLISQEAMEFTPYRWNTGGKDEETLVADTNGDYMLYYNGRVLDDSYLTEIMNYKDDIEFSQKIGSLAPATLRSGDGKCFPWIETSIENSKLEIKNQNGAPLKICKKEKDILGAVIAGATIRSQANSDDIKSLLYEWLGAVDHFKDGKMYYAHGIYNSINSTDKTNYGVVRNNWYRLHLIDIPCIGIPVDDPNQRIVPERVGNYDQINVSIYLLNWHNVETIIDRLN